MAGWKIHHLSMVDFPSSTSIFEGFSIALFQGLPEGNQNTPYMVGRSHFWCLLWPCWWPNHQMVDYDMLMIVPKSRGWNHNFPSWNGNKLESSNLDFSRVTPFFSLMVLTFKISTFWYMLMLKQLKHICSPRFHALFGSPNWHQLTHP